MAISTDNDNFDKFVWQLCSKYVIENKEPELLEILTVLKNTDPNHFYGNYKHPWYYPHINYFYSQIKRYINANGIIKTLITFSKAGQKKMSTELKKAITDFAFKIDEIGKSLDACYYCSEFKLFRHISKRLREIPVYLEVFPLIGLPESYTSCWLLECLYSNDIEFLSNLARPLYSDGVWCASFNPADLPHNTAYIVLCLITNNILELCCCSASRKHILKTEVFLEKYLVLSAESKKDIRIAKRKINKPFFKTIQQVDIDCDILCDDILY